MVVVSLVISVSMCCIFSELSVGGGSIFARRTNSGGPGATSAFSLYTMYVHIHAHVEFNNNIMIILFQYCTDIVFFGR